MTRQFLDGLRARFAAAAAALGPGEPLAEPVEVPGAIFAGLWRHELAPVDLDGGWFVWQTLGSELAVQAGESQVALRTGFVIAGLPVSCAEVPAGGSLVVPLATGTGQPTLLVDDGVRHLSTAGHAGLLMTAEVTARGGPLLVDAWGEIAVTACWAAVTGVARTVAAAAGDDRAGCPLIPGAVRTEDDLFVVVPQARHAIDRAGCC